MIDAVVEKEAAENDSAEEEWDFHALTSRRFTTHVGFLIANAGGHHSSTLKRRCCIFYRRGVVVVLMGSSSFSNRARASAACSPAGASPRYLFSKSRTAGGA